MPKINRSSKRSLSKCSSRTRRKIIQLENQDAVLANNLFLAPVDNSSSSPTNLNVPTNSSVHIDNIVESHVTLNHYFLKSNLFSDYRESINVPSSLSIVLSNFENPTKYFNNNSIESELKERTVKCKIAQCHLNELLIILRKHKGFETLPKDSRTLLQIPKINLGQIRSINPSGKYFHFGLTNYILKYFSNIEKIPNEIQLVIGIDGLPISHSSNCQLWPILAYVKPHNYLLEKKVFLVGLYWGKSKPIDSNEFLIDFVNEAK
jgi:hypothetical protein